MAIEIRDAVDADALRAAWPVVQQLRPEFDCGRYVARVLRQIADDGCRLTVLYDDGVPRAFYLREGLRIEAFHLGIALD